MADTKFVARVGIKIIETIIKDIEGILKYDLMEKDSYYTVLALQNYIQNLKEKFKL